jgi:hypothetical protein
VKNLFKAPRYSLPENYDHVVERVVTIDELPAGIGQTPQKLDEPIESMHFKQISVKESMIVPEKTPIRMITAEEAVELMASGKFHKAMVPIRYRACKGCQVELSSERHMYCTGCRPKLSEDPGHFLYCGGSNE